ncbi:MAG: hypothetical protein A2583_00780 [Bdellovibrionales bacterium RIFOXYD1_FULL_53_11]|nr:MAG: hypothetical protein A2583_00780 [Bdellovibrionales bacterium RIFOXYD1_FULL_53_11]
MGFKKKIFELVVDSAIKILGLNSGSTASCCISGKLFPVCRVRGGTEEYLFYCPNELTRWRTFTLFTKEPETIEWMNGFKAGDVLYDVGANVGLYSVYAAKKGVRVFSFEPEAQNYALINRNFYLNRIFDNASCFPVALSDVDDIDYLYLSGFEAGAAQNTFGESINWKQEEFAAKFKQGMLSRSLDSIVYGSRLPFPTHIKIDVDGLESKIIAGARKCLADPRLESVLVEINEKSAKDMGAVNVVLSSGFKLLHKKHSEMFEVSEYKNIYNYIFTRHGR